MKVHPGIGFLFDRDPVCPPAKSPGLASFKTFGENSLSGRQLIEQKPVAPEPLDQKSTLAPKTR